MAMLMYTAVRLRTLKRFAWQWTEVGVLPPHVSRSNEDPNVLVVERRSVRQLVLLGEWLVYDPDARYPEHYTDLDFIRTFEPA